MIPYFHCGVSTIITKEPHCSAGLSCLEAGVTLIPELFAIYVILWSNLAKFAFPSAFKFAKLLGSIPYNDER